MTLALDKAPAKLPRTIIFDLDGTVVDSWDSTMRFFNAIRLGVGLAELNPVEEKFIFTASIEEGIEWAIPKKLWPRARQIWQDTDFQALAAYTKPQPGIAELLGWLKGTGVGLGLNTNSGNETHQVLEAVGLAGYFDSIVTADNVPRPKPDSAGVRRILKDLNCSPADSVYIGDSHVDEKTARAAGVDFWLYGPAEVRADWRVEFYGELLDYFKGLAR